MSMKNRRKTYDQLIAEGRHDEISEPLKAEFGAPSEKKDETEPDAPIEKPKTKPKGKK